MLERLTFLYVSIAPTMVGDPLIGVNVITDEGDTAAEVVE
jgi:hypothetical protein